MSECVAIGVDVGSTTWKAVAIDSKGEILASIVEEAEPLIDKQTERALAELKSKLVISDSMKTGATGYGRKRVKADLVLTEITCHARGAFHRSGKGGVLIDIGGQDTKVIKIGKGGEVLDFSMNDKCAAGTGRFLEVILRRLRVPFEEVSLHFNKARKAVPVSNTCTVFAESEVVSLVAEGKEIDEIVKGLHQSLASRVAALAGDIAPESEVFMSGGVALNESMVKALSEKIGKNIRVLTDPQLIGALGAALAAR